ncbi:hypothetical protein [Nocardia fluminea]
MREMSAPARALVALVTALVTIPLVGSAAGSVARPRAPTSLRAP